MAIEVIDEIAPKNNSFRGLMQAQQLKGTVNSFGVNIGSGIGSVGIKPISFDMKIVGITLASLNETSVVVDIRVCAGGSLPSTASICASAKPTLSAARYATDTTLTGWTVDLSAGDVAEFVVESGSGPAILDVQYERR